MTGIPQQALAEANRTAFLTDEVRRLEQEQNQTRTVLTRLLEASKAYFLDDSFANVAELGTAMGHARFLLTNTPNGKDSA